MRAGGTEPYCLRSPEPGVLDTEKTGGRFRDAWGVICVELIEFATSAGEALEWIGTHRNSIPEANLRLLLSEREYEYIIAEHFSEAVDLWTVRCSPRTALKQWAISKGVNLWCYTGPQLGEEEEEPELLSSC